MASLSRGALGAWVAIVPLLASPVEGEEKGKISPSRSPSSIVSPRDVLRKQESPLRTRGTSPPRAESTRQTPGTAQFHPYAALMPAFVLYEIYYIHPQTSEYYKAKKQGSTWVLPVVDTLKERSVNFVFTFNLPKEEIADVVQNGACCYQLLVSNQILPKGAIMFEGEDKVRLWAPVANMQNWPKIVQLKMNPGGGVAPSSGGGGPIIAVTPGQKKAQAQGTKQPAKDYKSAPVSVQSEKVSYFQKLLFPTFSHERCTDCHSMGDKAAVEAQHAASDVSPVDGTHTHESGCAGSSCHVVADWRTPPFAMGIHWKGKSASEICNIVTTHLPTPTGLHAHFHDDPRVLWAVSDGSVPLGHAPLETCPPHGLQAWFGLVDEWIDGGRPCP